LQGHPAGLRLGTFPLRLLEFGQNRAPLLLKKGQLVLLSLLAGQRHNNQFTQFGKRLLPVGKFGKIGSHQHRTLGGETFAASDDALQRTLRVPTIRLFDVQALFGQGHLGTLAVDRRQRRNMSFLGQRQAFLACFEAQPALLDTFVGKCQQILPTFKVIRQIAGLRLPMRSCFGQLRQPHLILAPRLLAVTDLGFQACDFSIGGIKAALCRMHAIAGGKMGFPGLLDTHFEVTQSSVPSFEIDARQVDLARQSFALELCFIAPQKPK